MTEDKSSRDERDAMNGVFSRQDTDTRAAIVEVLRVERERLHAREEQDRDTIDKLAAAIAKVVE